MDCSFLVILSSDMVLLALSLSLSFSLFLSLFLSLSLFFCNIFTTSIYGHGGERRQERRGKHTLCSCRVCFSSFCQMFSPVLRLTGEKLDSSLCCISLLNLEYKDRGEGVVYCSSCPLTCYLF